MGSGGPGQTSLTIQLQWTAPLVDCLSLSRLGPLFSSGGMSLRLRAIQECIVHWNCSNSASGGRASPWTPVKSLLPALCGFSPRPGRFVTPSSDSSSPWTWVILVMGLLPSEGNTPILTIVDQSKMGHYIPLPKLPSALETASLLIQHVFRLHGIPQDSLAHLASVEEQVFLWTTNRSPMFRRSGPISIWRRLSAVWTVITQPPSPLTSLGCS